MALSILLLLQHQAWAYPLTPTASHLGMFEPISFVVAFFVGSLLVVESRRFGDFIWGLLLIAGVGTVIALLSVTWKVLSEIQPLWPVALVGLGLGIGIAGLWWWGYRQAYVQALVATLNGKPLNASPTNSFELPEEAAGFFNTLHLRAQAIRYRRLVNSGEMNTLVMAIRHHIQQDWKHYRTAQLEHEKAQKRQRIQALLAKADHACGQSPFASVASVSNSPEPGS
ncbi:MAG: hypothetical protein AAGD09_06345 [Cyanobacteria bacterium P01_F01_bin.56]